MRGMGLGLGGLAILMLKRKLETLECTVVAHPSQSRASTFASGIVSLVPPDLLVLMR